LPPKSDTRSPKFSLWPASKLVASHSNKCWPKFLARFGSSLLACTKTTDYIRVDFRTTKFLFFLKLMKTIFQFNEKPRQNGRKKDKITESMCILKIYLKITLKYIHFQYPIPAIFATQLGYLSQCLYTNKIKWDSALERCIRWIAFREGLAVGLPPTKAKSPPNPLVILNRIKVSPSKSANRGLLRITSTSSRTHTYVGIKLHQMICPI